MIHEFHKPIPVVTLSGEEGYAIYVQSGGMLENDCWCIVLCDGGTIRHMTTDQIKIHHNATYGIIKKDKI